MMDANEDQDPQEEIKLQAYRTLAIMQQLVSGKHLSLRDGRTIAMSEDLTIGYLMHREDGTTFVENLNRLTFKQLNDICEDNYISIPIPDMGVRTIHSLARQDGPRY